MRATTSQWPRWIARQLLMPVWRMPCTITTRSGTRCRLGGDRVDDIVLRDIHAGHPELYFPRMPGFDPTGVILDVGAHHGLYTTEALRRYPRCRALAVEPDPVACRRIALNAALNGLEARIGIVRAALGETAGTGRLERDPGGSWATRVRPVTEAAPSPGYSGDLVPMRTLDEILEGERPTVIKCNAEGAEFALVPQLIRLGLRPALVVLMVHPEFGRPEDLVRRLQAAGYTVRDADDPPRGHRFHCVGL